MARWPDTAHGNSSSSPYDVSVTYNQGCYNKSGGKFEAQQLRIMAFVQFFGFNQLDFVELVYYLIQLSVNNSN
jgi:hypothetical protein